MDRVFLLLASLLLVPAGASAEAALPVHERLIVFEDDAQVLPVGVELRHAYSNLPIALVAGTTAALETLLTDDGVRGIYTNDPLETHVDLARAAHGAAIEAGVSERGRGVGIAVVDTGIDPLHPGFSGRLTNYVVGTGGVTEGVLPIEGDSHGTHVAGIMAGDGSRSPDNRYRGMAPSAHLLGLDISGEFNTANALRAFDWILDNHDAERIRIVSNSWGRQGDVDGIYDPNAPLVIGASELVDAGLIVVFSAGNRGGVSNMDTEALNPDVLTVGATDVAGRLRSFSSQGPPLSPTGTHNWTKPDVVAVGEQIVSARGGLGTSALDFGDRSLAPVDYRTDRGTSMAAAVVTGAAALILEADPTLQPDEVAAILRGTARDVGAAGVENQTGWGFIDVPLAVKTARSGMLLPGAHERSVSVAYDFTVSHALGVPVRVLPAIGIPSGTGFAVKFPVAQGSDSVRFEAAWGQAFGASFTARALSPDGGRHTMSGTSTSRSVDITLPEPGLWTVQLTPGNGIWETSLDITATVDASHRVSVPFTVRELVEESVPPPEVVPQAEAPIAAPGIAAFVVLLAAALMATRRQND